MIKDKLSDIHWESVQLNNIMTKEKTQISNKHCKYSNIFNTV